MMAEPARLGADGREPDDAEPAGPGPGEPRWSDILTTEIQAMRLAVEELARRPDSAAALEMAGLNLAVAVRLAAKVRQRRAEEVSDAVVEVERARAYAEGYAEGYAACKAERRRLGVIDGGKAAGWDGVFR